MEVKIPNKGFTSELKKSDPGKIFERVDFGAPEAFILVFKFIFSIYQYFKVTRRAGCSIPTRRVIRMQGNLHFQCLRPIYTLKDFELKFEGAPSVQISILMHFREAFFA